jgi:(2S)-methylsuccinyl-CoA dehydrogenase
MTAPDLAAAATVTEIASGVVEAATRRLAAAGSIDDQPGVGLRRRPRRRRADVRPGPARLRLQGRRRGPDHRAFIADALAELGAKLFGREAEWGVAPDALDGARDFVATYRAADFLASLANTDGPRHLGDDFEMVQDAFRRFAEDKIMPIAEHIHRHNGDIPEEIVTGLAEMGAFGLSIPEEYGGFASGGDRTTSPWSSPPRSCRAARSAPAAR